MGVTARFTGGGSGRRSVERRLGGLGSARPSPRRARSDDHLDRRLGHARRSVPRQAHALRVARRTILNEHHSTGNHVGPSSRPRHSRASARTDGRRHARRAPATRAHPVLRRRRSRRTGCGRPHDAVRHQGSPCRTLRAGARRWQPKRWMAPTTGGSHRSSGSAASAVTPRRPSREAELLARLGYHAGLLSLAALATATEDALLAHCKAVSELLPHRRLLLCSRQ